MSTRAPDRPPPSWHQRPRRRRPMLHQRRPLRAQRSSARLDLRL